MIIAVHQTVPEFAPSLLLAGVDEAGRGPLAGPVAAAAVILDPGRPINGESGLNLSPDGTRPPEALISPPSRPLESRGSRGPQM